MLVKRSFFDMSGQEWEGSISEQAHFCKFFMCNITWNKTLVPAVAKAAQLSSINRKTQSGFLYNII